PYTTLFRSLLGRLRLLGIDLPLPGKSGHVQRKCPPAVVDSTYCSRLMFRQETPAPILAAPALASSSNETPVRGVSVLPACRERQRPLSCKVQSRHPDRLSGNR